MPNNLSGLPTLSPEVLEEAEKIVARLLPIFQKNYPLETRDKIWDVCMASATKVPLNAVNLEFMSMTALITGFGGFGESKELFVQLARALGICGITNPENDAFFGKPMRSAVPVENFTHDELLDKIQEQIPFPMEFPVFTGTDLKRKTKYGITTNRYIHYLWVVKRVLEFCPDKNVGIIEIGPGYGLLGYYLDKAGYKDYTIIDLALTNACQTYYLTKNLPHRNLILSGDVTDPFDLKHKDSVKILHCTDFKDIPDDRFALMVNMDGLTEMGIEQASKYVQSNCAKDLFSVNHEVNSFRVCDIQPNNRRKEYRYPFWLRPGYVEELFRRI